MRPSHTILVLALSWACTLPGDASDRSEPPQGSAPSQARSVIDSILPPAEEMRRFRAGGGARRDALTGGAASRDDLGRAFLDALSTHDTIAIRSLLLDRFEFADIYYPASRFAHPPYRTPIGLLWTQIQLNSEKGITRAMRRLGGQPMKLVDVVCVSPPETIGRSRLHDRCVTRYITPAGDTASRRLFGAIIETAGRAKFVSYANDM